VCESEGRPSGLGSNIYWFTHEGVEWEKLFFFRDFKPSNFGDLGKSSVYLI